MSVAVRAVDLCKLLIEGGEGGGGSHVRNTFSILVFGSTKHT